jgi:hypothetical protein
MWIILAWVIATDGTFFEVGGGTFSTERACERAAMSVNTPVMDKALAELPPGKLTPNVMLFCEKVRN